MPESPLIPDAFATAMRARGPEPPDSRTPGIDGDTWLTRLPRLVQEASARWDLRLDTSPSRHGVCALVVPVLRADGEPAALKITWPHPESRHEHLALRAWAGDGAVRLLAAHPADDVLLLQRLDADRDLAGEPIEAACTRIGQLLRRLDRPALPQLDTLAEWTRGLVEKCADPDPRLPRRFVDQARSLAADLLADAALRPLDDRLVHTDLHFGNVLAVMGTDGSWLAIDPKPMAAEPAYAVWPALHNRWAEALDGDLAWNIRCRLGWICEAAGLDEERARAWAIVRTVADASWLLRSSPAAGAGDLLSRRIRLLKALQPDA